MHHGDGMAAPTVGVHEKLPIAEVPTQDEHPGRPLPADGLLPPGLVLELDHVAELLIGQLREVRQLRGHAPRFSIEARRMRRRSATGFSGKAMPRFVIPTRRSGTATSKTPSAELVHAKGQWERQRGEETHEAAQEEVLCAILRISERDRRRVRLRRRGEWGSDVAAAVDSPAATDMPWS